MTDEELKQWVREQVAVLLINISALDEYGGEKKYALKDFSSLGQEVWLSRADRILSLKKPDGTPAIGIISDDQSLPHIPYSLDAIEVFNNPVGVYRQAQKDMASFVRLAGGKDARD